MQRGKKPTGANDLVDVEAIKARISVLGKLKNLKPVVDTSKIDVDKQRADPNVYSSRYLSFVREVAENGNYKYLKNNCPDVFLKLKMNDVSKQDQDTEKKIHVDDLTKKMSATTIKAKKPSKNGNPFSPQKETEWLLKKVRDLIDKVNTENKEEVFNEFLSYEVTVPQHGCTLTSPEFDKQVHGVVDIIFEKVVENHEKREQMSTLLAELCKRQASVGPEICLGNVTIFRCAVLERIHTTFLQMHNMEERLRLSDRIVEAKNPRVERIRYQQAEAFLLENHEVSLSITRFVAELYESSIINASLLQAYFGHFDSILTVTGIDEPIQQSSVICAVNLLDLTMDKLILENCVLWIAGYLDAIEELIINYQPEIKVMRARCEQRFLLKSGSADPFKCLERLMYM